ncbi:MAG: alpha/beta hydrolase [Bacteroidota bacterium]
METNIPFAEFGENGSIIHFAHANGFPPNCYQPLLNSLSKKNKILAMLQRPLWENSDPEKFKSWHVLAEDLIGFLDEKKLKNIIGIGHSMGGVATAIAAAKRPDLFSHVILIDPVLFATKFHLIKNIMPLWLRKKNFPIAKIALKRKDKWPSKNAAYDSWRSKKIFSLIPDRYFTDFIDGAIRENTDGSAILFYPKKWEAQVYCTPSNAWPFLARLKQPTLAIKADGTNLLFPPIWDKWKKIQPSATFYIVENASHLVPLERPEVLVKVISEFLRKS